jgi:hypothetical protein
MNKTATLREHLMVAGPATAAQLERATGVPSIRVRSLLDHDIKMGRVAWSPVNHSNPMENAGIYSWIDQQAVAIEKAIRLLKASGYNVERRAA